MSAAEPVGTADRPDGPAPWSCATCAVEQPPSAVPPRSCPICEDERQYVRPTGQRWVRLAELQAQGHRGSLVPLEPGLVGVRVSPQVGIGQQALLVQTEAGNLLWDPTGFVDDELAALVRDAGGVAAIASSHPHMFGCQLEWSRRFDDAPVHVNEADAGWLQREGPAVRLWQESAEPVPGVQLRRIGGHFAGSAVAHWTGADGRGVLLSGDTVASTPDERWVSFLRSYPNKIPLSGAVVGVVAQRLAQLEFDRLYDNFDGRCAADASSWVQRSAERYIAWVTGEFDDLTGTL
jgi:hypothetical protein